MQQRWWRHEGMSFELALSHRTPQLLIVWPAIPAPPRQGRSCEWRDEAGIGLDLLAAGEAWPLVELAAGALTDALRAAVRGADPRPPEEPGRIIRTWSCLAELGFLPGDLDEVDALTVTRASARTESYAHQYGARSGERCFTYTRAELASADCPARALIGPCVPRLDAWLARLGP